MLKYFIPALIVCFGVLPKNRRHGFSQPFAMSPKRWFLLLIFYISYLMFGASIYYHIEHGLEKEQRAEQLKEQTEVNDYIMDLLVNYNETIQYEAQLKLTDYCGRPVTAPNELEYQIPYKWTFYHSFFFVFTVCSTVGYGNLAPSSELGQMIMILYSVIGIPVNGILYAGLGEYFGKLFVAIYRRYKKYQMGNNTRYVPLQLGLITTVIIALVPGITFFLLIPAWAFHYFEGWSYITSIYYAYVTTTTIGFGDIVATFEPTQPAKFGGWFIVYEIYVILWMIFSLGYLVMIMTYITRGLQSKRLARLEQQFSTNIKATQNRIWSGVTKDVGYLRRLLNEMYIMKFKPEYTEPEIAILHNRSISCPDLTLYRIDGWPNTVSGRKRAFSECYDTAMQNARAGVHDSSLTMLQAISDSALDRLDKQRTFETAETVRSTTELLAKVVNALAAVKVPAMDEDGTYGGMATSGMYGGYHGFSDSEILASEWSFTSTNGPPPKPRGRACSDFNIVRRSVLRNNDWTWSGDNDQIQEAINKRTKQAAAGQHDYVVHMEEDDVFKKTPSKKFSIPDGLRKIFKRQPSQDAATMAKGAANRKISIMSVPETQQHHPALDYYSTVTASASPTFFQQQQLQLQRQQQNGKPTPPAMLNSSALMYNNAAYGRRGSMFDPQQTLTANAFPPPSTSALPPTYQRNAAATNKKRRESIFTQNPVLAARRGSAVAFSQQQQRRGSLFTEQQPQRRGSGVAPSQLPPAMQRRGSMFPTTTARRPSIFSVTSEEDMEVLENTTVADLIRALEVVHTQSIMGEAAAAATPATKARLGFVDCFSSDSRKRRDTDAGLNPPELPPILSLFGGNSNEALSAVAANRLYTRRATVVGNGLWAPTTAPTKASSTTPGGNILTRRKSTVQMMDPPPSYSEREPSSSNNNASSAISKFKRRFSIRPTALCIPPGKAPPPSTLPTIGGSMSTAAPSPTTAPSLSHTALHRRLSLRPSPLARELNIQTQSSSSSSADTSGPTSPTTPLVSAARPPPVTTTSTHSPLSRIVQISQAQRKGSMPDATTKPEGGK